MVTAGVLLLAGAAAAAPAGGVEACRTCHPAIAATFVQTAHFQTSRRAGAESIKGSFTEGTNLLRTRVDGTYFRMEKRRDGFYQTGYEKGKSHTERFDLVIGSGRRGQSYLYWRNGLLFQLPVSYLAAADEWINSPGYPDGEVHFGRLIPPRCLECHSTDFHLEGELPKGKYTDDYALGISCPRCHGGGTDHAKLRNPARFSRERKIDTCAYCHSGIREPRKPLFSYRPGEVLDDYLAPEADAEHARPDVHGNQVALLRRSKCFQASADMSCSTCHDVHRQETDLAQLSRKCDQCHQPAQCKLAAKVGAGISNHCVTCHMPNQRSNLIVMNTSRKQVFQLYRTHIIGIYADVAQKFLQASR